MSRFLAAALVSALPLAASAATLSSGDQLSLADVLLPGQSVSFDITPTDTLLVDLSFALTGKLADLQAITFDFGTGTTSFTTFDTNGQDPEIALFQIDDYQIGTAFTISFTGAVQSGVAIAVTLDAEAAPPPAPPAVPLPASVLMLGAGLAGLGLAGRRRG